MKIIPNSKIPRVGTKFMAGNGNCPCIILGQDEFDFYIEWYNPDKNYEIVAGHRETKKNVIKAFEDGYYKIIYIDLPKSNTNWL